MTEIERLQRKLDREKASRIEELEAELAALKTGKINGEGPGVFRLNQGLHEAEDPTGKLVQHGEAGTKVATKIYRPGDKIASKEDLVMRFGPEKFTRVGGFPIENVSGPDPSLFVPSSTPTPIKLEEVKKPNADLLSDNTDKGNETKSDTTGKGKK